jgi:transposase
MSKVSKRKRAQSSQGAIRSCDGMSKINACAAGVDMGAHEILACVPDGDDQQIVRACGTYTAALDSLADWCIDRGIQTVAMASTGVYWMPLFETLEARGIPCCLLRASSVQHVPGRKSDV